MPDAPAAMRFCAGCCTVWAVEPQVNPDARDSLWRCPDCTAKRVRARLPLLAGSRCRHADYQAGPLSVLLITAAEGEYARVHPLGFPDLAGHDGRSRYHRGELIAEAVAAHG